mgnify:FL=1
MVSVILYHLLIHDLFSIDAKKNLYVEKLNAIHGCDWAGQKDYFGLIGQWHLQCSISKIPNVS